MSLDYLLSISELFRRGIIDQCHLTTNCLKYCIAFLFLAASISSGAQSEIPLGTWRLHISYNDIHAITLSDKKVFGASENGIAVLDKLDNSLTTYTKLDGLHGMGITAMSYHNATAQLLIAYEDGILDLIKNNTITFFDPAGSSTVTGSKKINHISYRDNLAYLATDYGVVIFDLVRNDIKETWRDIGVGGETVKIFKTTFQEDSIFMATDHGVFAGDLSQNLLDFNFWKRFDTGEFSDSIQSIEAFNGKVYATVKDVGLYRYELGAWTKEGFLQNGPLQSLNSSAENLLVSSGPTLWRLSATNVLSEVPSDRINYPNMALEEPGNKLWIADNTNGMISNATGNFTSYFPNGPANGGISKLGYHNKIVYALGGGYSSTFAPLRKPGKMDLFSQGRWSTQNSSMFDLSDLTFDQTADHLYVASFGYGVEERNAVGSVQIFDDTNSALVNINPPDPFVTITAVQHTDEGLWVANYGTAQSLHFLTNDNAWISYSLTPTVSRYPMDMDVDFYGSVWLIPEPTEGGGVIVYNREENTTSYLTDIEGSGGLPDKSVRCITVDRDGLVWLGTDEGVCYFPDPSSVFASGVTAVRPIFDDRFLLRDDRVTAIAVDGGNRKWMGTERGVWLFGPSGEELIYNFTADNSPLLSNIILDIEINHETGEVFFATDLGLISFRSDATESDSQFQSVKIFPNPVTPEFNGLVGISGLATDAIVKITDIAGKLVWQAQANGGTASWNVRDVRGQRASTGMYLVFSATPDGSESVVGKIAVVE